MNPLDMANHHQVLAYGYELDGNDLKIHVYDPTWSGADEVISLNISDPNHATDVLFRWWKNMDLLGLLIASLGILHNLSSKLPHFLKLLLVLFLSPASLLSIVLKSLRASYKISKVNLILYHFLLVAQKQQFQVKSERLIID